MLKITFATARSAKNKAIALIVGKDAKLGAEGAKLDKALSGALTRGLKASPSFKGKEGQTLVLRAPSKNGPSLIVLVGVGDVREAGLVEYEKAGGAAYSALVTDGVGEGALIVDDYDEAVCPIEEATMHAALGAQLASYRFDKLKAKKKKPAPKLKGFVCILKAAAEVKKAYADLQAVAHGVHLTRDLVTEPANTMDPDAMVEVARSLERYGVEVDILDEEEMEDLGMNALLSVGLGSAKPAYLAVMKWHGAESEKERPIALVGKGVTFDTGGISLKPSPGMGDMKYDMAGAGAVLGAMKAIAMRKAKANVVGIIGLVENMPSSTAQRPGDVVKSAAGHTIEILNTDAEGRLVLADALWYAQKFYRPKAIVDLATLTRAMVISLGNKYGGVFCNDDDLAFALAAAGEDTNDQLWRMPLHDDYDKLIDSPIADMQNIGPREAGSITAAQFLQRFINKNVAWAHLDIAGKAWEKKGKATCPKGATGFGVRLLDKFVSDFAES